MDKLKQENNLNDKKTSSKGKTTEELTKRHLKDKNDKITDEDIRNIEIETSVKPEEPLKLKKKHAHDVDKDNPKSTPWDIISE